MNVRGEHQESPLHEAAHAGCIPIIKLFDKRRDLIDTAIPATGKWPGATAFHTACKIGNLDAARTLLDMGAAINATYTDKDIGKQTGLHAAAQRNKSKIIQLFKDRPDILHAKAANGYTAQDQAVLNTSLSFLRELVNCGVEAKITENIRRHVLQIGSIFDFYVTNFASRIEPYLQMIQASCTPAQERAIVRCLGDYYFLERNSKNPKYDKKLDEITASCLQLASFITTQQAKRIDRAITVVTSSDLKCTEENIHELLELLSFQHLLYDKWGDRNHLSSLMLRATPLFSPLKAILTKLFELFEQRDVQKDELQQLSQKLKKISILLRRVFNSNISDHLRETCITPFQQKCNDLIKQCDSRAQVTDQLQNFHLTIKTSL